MRHLVLGVAVLIGGCALPEPLLVGGADLTGVSAGGYNSCGLNAQGTVFCWGRDGVTEAVVYPTQVVLGFRRARQISVGHDYACALMVEGDPICWAGVSGQFSELKGAPTLDSIFTGRFPCGTTAGGAVWCWMNGDEPTEVAEAGELSGLAVESFACALTPTGKARCWGGPFPVVPTAVHDSITWTQIEPMWSWGCGVPVGGSARCFTVSPAGVVGVASTVDTTVIADGTKFVALAGEGDYLALQSDGGRIYWRTRGNAMVLPEGSTSDWDWIDSGAGHTCGRLIDDRLVCFRLNDFGQLGDGTDNFRVNATPIGRGEE